MKPIKLYAFTATVGLASLLPPTRLVRSLPAWWEKLAPQSDLLEPSDPLARRFKVERILTARHCYGMQETFKRGFGLRLWSDVDVVITRDGNLNAYGYNREVKVAGGVHHPKQFPDLFSSSCQHFKFLSPWHFVCESPVHFAWMHPLYHQGEAFRFQSMPGIVEYRNQHATNVNIVLPRTAGERQEFHFQAGEMLAYILPLCDQRVELVVEEISDIELRRINAAHSVTEHPLRFNRRFKVAPWIPRLAPWRRRREL
jgi:hypothetical protein